MYRVRIGMNNIARGMWPLKEEYYFTASKEGTLLLVFLRPSSIHLSSPWNHFVCRLAISIQLSRIFLTAPAFISIISQSSFARNSKFAKSSPTNEYIETLLRRLRQEKVEREEEALLRSFCSFQCRRILDEKRPTLFYIDKLAIQKRSRK